MLRDHVFVIFSPQWLDGKEISRSEQIRAGQGLEVVRRRVQQQEQEYLRRRAEEKEQARRQGKGGGEEERKEKKPGFDGCWYTDINNTVYVQYIRGILCFTCTFRKQAAMTGNISLNLKEYELDLGFSKKQNSEGQDFMLVETSFQHYTAHLQRDVEVSLHSVAEDQWNKDFQDGGRKWGDFKNRQLHLQQHLVKFRFCSTVLQNVQ